VVDSHGLVHAGRRNLDPDKAEVAWPADAGEGDPSLPEVVADFRPTVLLGATGMPGTFDEPLIAALAAGADRPIVMPLSNPTAACEAQPADILRWSGVRAIFSTRSPCPSVAVGRRTVEVGQANNVFVFPGLGLGAIAAEASMITHRLFLLAATTLRAAGDRARRTT